MGLILVIGSKEWSSWSLRPWIALKRAGIAFDERLIPLYQPDTKTRILEYAPSGKVPILLDGDITVWDSLAILDYIATCFPDAGLWPEDRAARALALSVSAEMHAGFAALRRELSMNVTIRVPTPELSEDASADVRRIQAIWRDARGRFGSAGPFLFGGFTNADAMFAPVAARFHTYDIPLDRVSQNYMETILKLPAMEEWYHAASSQAGSMPVKLD